MAKLYSLVPIEWESKKEANHSYCSEIGERSKLKFRLAILKTQDTP